MTLIEIMIVLALMGMLLGAVTMMVVRSPASRLREETLKVLGALRSAYNGAAASGSHHRVVLDLDEQTYRIEICEGEQGLRRTEEEEKVDREELEERLERPVSREYHKEIIEADTVEGATAAAAALAGMRVGSAQCTLSQGLTGSMEGDGNQGTIDSGNAGVRIKRVHVQHLEEPIEEGIVSINFFPLGYAEKAVVEMEADDDQEYFLLVHRISGRVEFESDEDFDPEDHMRRNALGEDVEEDR